jgi:hypothetical protein
MNWLRSEDLKEEKNVTAPIIIVAGPPAIAFGSLSESSCSAGQTPYLIRIDQSAFRIWPTLLMTLERRYLWVAAPFQKYPAHFAASQWIC